MTSSQLNPRRRYLNADTPTSFRQPLRTHDVFTENTSTDRPLRKCSTFHSPTTPPAQDEDPILSVPSLPRRSPTCPRALENAVAAGERIVHLLDVVDRSLSGLETFSNNSEDTFKAEDLPVPRFMLDAHVAATDAMEIDSSSYKTNNPRTTRKHHSSDSGIGSTVTGSDEKASRDHAALEDYKKTTSATVNEVRSGINGNAAVTSDNRAGNQHALSEFACREIQKHIIAPIVREESLKDFHPLVQGIPYRVGRKEITCLRDLEKVLLWLAPKWSVSKASFLNFCETSIQCIHTTVGYLNEPDQRRPTDRPYTNGYFLDLTEQVRQYAAMISASRARMANGRGSAEDEAIADSRLGLHGGLSRNGRPVELVRIKNGQTISLSTGSTVKAESDTTMSPKASKRPSSEDLDDDVLRSMGRRRKGVPPPSPDSQRCRDCDKTFKRPCDLTKHEKTHTRPWKCSEISCKYHEYGWPTEKERDRHVNDKHSASPSMFKCQYRPCPYESKRESNCKQHMEKAHGWAYVRSKNNGKSGKKGPTFKTPPTPQNKTPGSDIFEASSPDFAVASPFASRGSITNSVNGSIAASDDYGTLSSMDTPFMATDDIFPPFDPNIRWDDSYSGLTPAGGSSYSSSSHQQSWDAGSTANAPAPGSFETSMEENPLFTENFDWSNINTDFTSYNIQLVTPATSIDTRSMDAYSRNPSISLEQPAPSGEMPSLSPGAQGNLMLYSPYSQNDGPVDEGYEDFVADGKPATDFALFDGSGHTSNMGSAANGQMFQDLASFGPTGWSGRGTELAHQLGMQDIMQVDEE
ncbi:zinc finger transcription factor ace1 [Physcia stellaris]|nr:zinc finger transcription factor ace1 [Physcia stellaris]